MLPGGPLAKKQLTKLKLYQGTNHPHQSQKIEEINFLKSVNRKKFFINGKSMTSQNQTF